MKVLALVTSKSRSTRVPYKNKALLHGKPLYKWTTDFIEKHSDFFHALCFSSDRPHDYNIRDYWFKVKRSDYLIADSTPHIESVQHALECVEQETGATFDAVMLFQPTNPYRTSQLLYHSMTLLEYTIEKSKQSKAPPCVVRCSYRDDNLARKYLVGASWIEDVNESPRVLSGSLYSYPRAYLEDTSSKVEHIIMVPKEIGYNINDQMDMVIAESMMKHRGVPYGYSKNWFEGV
jgi:hypothetical protein